MRLSLFSLVLTLALAPAASAFEIEDHRRFGSAAAVQELRVISTTDTAILAPLIESYARANPEVAIDYTVASSTELVKAVTDGSGSFDLALSSAMDLQTKISNDGLTLAHNSAATELAPAWGNWRNHVFAFTQEPATIVLSPAAFDGLDLPRSRQELVDILRAYPDRFNGRIGTYDIRVSGAGYLFATQDARTSESYWRLMEIFGGLSVKLYCCSGKMIDQVARGDLAVAYNVVGSYARARSDLESRITVVEPEDYTNMMLRTAVILRASPDPELAGSFVDHLLQAAWGSPAAAEYPFQHFPHGADGQSGSLRPIQLGPGLLVFLDQLKRKRFLSEWESAVVQD
jgi:iron(III) transport system substrate-binding protein